MKMMLFYFNIIYYMCVLICSKIFKNINCLIYIINYIITVGFPTMTINEFRNNHCGRGGSTTTSTIFNLWG